MTIDIEQLSRLHAATTQGNRTAEGHAWVAGVALDVEGNPPLIAWNQHAGNWVNEPQWGRIAQFDKAEDRDFALAAHNAWPEIAKELQRLLTIEKDAILIADNIQGQATRVGNPGRPGISAVTGMADEIERLRARVAELEFDPRLNTAWIRDLASKCKEHAERQRANRKVVADDDLPQSILVSSLSIGREEVYSDMHVYLSGWADKFERLAAERDLLPPTPHDLSDSK